MCISWVSGVANGGTAVIDYRVSFDQATGIFVELGSVTVLAFTKTGLTKGNTYTFRVEARNAYGYSAFSQTVSILAAEKPETPGSPLTTFVGSTVTVSWTPTDSKGSPITKY